MNGHQKKRGALLPLLGLALVIASVPVPSVAANWVQHGYRQDHASIFIDGASLKLSGHGILAWLKYDTSTANSFVEGDVDHIVLSQEEFNCELRQYRIKYRIGYDYLGNTNYTRPTPDLSFQPVIPDTEGEEVLRYLCSLPVRGR